MIKVIICDWYGDCKDHLENMNTLKHAQELDIETENLKTLIDDIFFGGLNVYVKHGGEGKVFINVSKTNFGQR